MFKVLKVEKWRRLGDNIQRMSLAIGGAHLATTEAHSISFIILLTGQLIKEITYLLE